MRPSYVPKDIEGYEERILFGLTMRQAFWGALAMIFGLGFYFLINSILHLLQDIAIYGAIAISFGFFALGWAKWQETRPFSDYLKAVSKFYGMKQLVIYSNEMNYFSNKEVTNVQNRRQNKKINKQCVEYRK